MAPPPSNIILAFDLYGTLLSTDSIAQQLTTHFGPEKAPQIASLWRRYQLEYTWRLNSMNQTASFSTLTSHSLTHALASCNLSLSPSSTASLLKSYDSLSTFPDVSPALEALASAPDITAVVFSNGTQAMVANSVHSSPDLSPHSSVFKHIVTVDKVGKFKPAPEVYFHLAESVGRGKSREEMAQMWLVSGNPFDVVGARAVGMQAAWVDRGGEGWTDTLVEGEEGGRRWWWRGWGRWWKWWGWAEGKRRGR
ncbi:MAG: haloacid type II [Lasallia pustulata]|uniref:Haloacid type II n=1 Tax=Lasallia pustulata TaxID=136370 RepID=A0A5M8PIV9_9LECA|nr:MAG: haloacid type II [Lasallia pustulata]